METSLAYKVTSFGEIREKSIVRAEASTAESSKKETIDTVDHFPADTKKGILTRQKNLISLQSSKRGHEKHKLTQSRFFQEFCDIIEPIHRNVG